ncbi:MAG: PepSY-associated TM helix domain-containing protein [Deltaproteobacteria bacterium]|nr:PepSY-associated TM helix domain-containing protein [Deltaproteobacteria bacterium]MDQ3297318.1 PepSY-associated TM helix domain-containing protein [Myxococcota bacterium]
MRWRKLFRALHRDIGYVAVSLTIAYAISGIAVNHIDDWNPNYSYADEAFDLGPLPAGTLGEQEAFVVTKLGLDRRSVRGHFLETATELRVFLTDGQEARLDVRTGRGRLKSLAKRAVFFEVNALHLNNLKGIWTYIADIFAIALMVLAITGMTMMKGDRGFAGRGKYFVGAGLLIPIAFVIYLYSA